MHRLLYLLILAFTLIGCSENRRQNDTSVITLTIENGYNQKIILENIPSAGNEKKVIDSVFIKDRVEVLEFIISDKEENLYRLHTADFRVDIIFINDAPTVKIKSDYFNEKEFECTNSMASSSLHHFLRYISQKVNNRKKQDPLAIKKDAALKNIFEEIQTDYRNYVDTVASPAAALYIYNNVDFAEDRPALKKYITKLGTRFPTHTAIQKLVGDTKNYLSLFEEEYVIGDTLPELILPDTSGKLVPLSFYKGQYLLIDFWASWHEQSRLQGVYKKRAYEQFKNRKFSIVSISLDPEKDMWKQALIEEKFPWPQLIDEKVWMGPATITFKFDSIPFNFLVNSSGKIIGKALYGDSLTIKLSQLIK